MSTLVIVDTRVADYQTLLTGLATDSEILLLDPDLNGVQQIADYLEGKSGFTALHIVSHGSSGALYLGGSDVNLESLNASSTLWKNIGSSLTDSGDILLYGCNVAQGETGQSFINALAQYSGAEVAASTNLTGAATLGGDGVLELATGGIEAAVLDVDGLTGTLLANTAPTFTVRDGKVTTDFGAGSNDHGRCVTVQSNGKILVAGESSNGSNDDFALVRYNTDGSLDTSFSGDGKVTTDFGTSWDDGLSVTVQSDGKILVAGSSNDNFALVRYNANGSLDTSFSGDGKVTTAIGTIADHGKSVTVQSDGKILVAGSSQHCSSYDFALVRYNTDGSLDSSFSGDGKVTAAFGMRWDVGQSVTVQSDGKILVAGSGSGDFGGSGDFALVRYNMDGSLDTSFSGDGTVTTDIGTRWNEGHSVTVQSNSKILVAGSIENGSSGFDFGLVRYNTDGSLDTSFSGDGKVTTDFGMRWDDGNSVTVQSDGKILVAGSSSGNFALVRYNTDGSLDTSFSGDGKVTTAIGTGGGSCNSVTVQSDGKILVAGGSGGDFALVRYNTDGSLDRSFVPLDTLSSSANSIYTEGNSPVVLAWNAQILDAELSATGNYYGASLTLSRHGGANAEDVFSAMSGGTLTPGAYFAVDSVSIGRVTVNNSGTLTLAFNANATQFLVDKAMQQIAYANTADAPPATVQIDWTFNDGNTGAQGTGGAKSVTGSTTVSITATNDAPILTNALADQTATASVPFNYVLPSNAFTDPDGETLAYSFALADGTGAPPWLNFNATTRTFSGTPETLDVGTWNIRVTARDSVNASISDVFTLNITAPSNVFPGGPGNDNLVGLASNDVLNGLAGNDTLDGGAGADAMAGGDGNDLYKVDNAGDSVSETNANLATGGNDTVWSTLSYTLGGNVENLRLNGSGDSDATGNGQNNVLYAGTGNNRLDGGAGVDTASYQYATAAVTLSLASTLAQASGGSGNDTLIDIENLTGSSYDDILIGNAAANVLDGGLGSDLLNGGAGNDTYVVNDIDDVVVEVRGVGSGIDLIKSSIAYTLGAYQEKLTLTGTTAINGTGNSLNNTLTGNSAANTLQGLGGADTLLGNGGADMLNGGAGDDTLTGGAGQDGFVFDTLVGRDTIKDFSLADDTLRLEGAVFTSLSVGALSPAAFASGAGLTAAQDADDRILYNTTTGALYFDADGTGSGAAVQFATLWSSATTHPNLGLADIVVV